MKTYYSAMFDLSQKSTVVIGGGVVAERKIKTLLEARTKITIVSPKLTENLECMVRDGSISWIDRIYHKGDLKDFFLIIIATNNSQINFQIYRDIDHKNQFVNIVDNPDFCTFIVPATINRGLLHIGVSTHGASPGLSKKIKEKLEIQYNENYAKYTVFLAEMRKWIFSQDIDSSKRKHFFNILLNDEWLEKISTENKDNVVEEFKSLFKRGISKGNG